MQEVKHKLATGLIKWFLIRSHKVAFTNPLTMTISYLLNVPTMKTRLVRHELVHIAQIQREGRFVFIVKYLWYMVTVGYERNKYELEAYKKQDEEK